MPRRSKKIRSGSRCAENRTWPGKNIKFDAQRIDNPERIFFDLLDTNLTSALLGKTFDVEDGLLKKIRVAQFQPGKARIVLEVEDRSDYTTFLLTDPPRLIIDVHSKDIHPDIQARNGRRRGLAGERQGVRQPERNPRTKNP